MTLKDILSQPCFNLSGLERELKIPRGGLEAFVSNRRGLAEKYQKKIVDYLKSFGSESIGSL
jgi:hypothetical protein